MASPKDELSYSAQVSPKEAAEYLETLARSIRDGVMLLEAGDASISLELNGAMNFALEASGNAEKGKNRLELSLSWRAAEQMKPQPSLVIVAGAAAEPLHESD